MGEFGFDWRGVLWNPSREADLALLATVDAWKRPGEVRLTAEARSPSGLRGEVPEVAAAAAADGAEPDV